MTRTKQNRCKYKLSEWFWLDDTRTTPLASPHFWVLDKQPAWAGWKDNGRVCGCHIDVAANCSVNYSFWWWSWCRLHRVCLVRAKVELWSKKLILMHRRLNKWLCRNRGGGQYGVYKSFAPIGVQYSVGSWYKIFISNGTVKKKKQIHPAKCRFLSKELCNFNLSPPLPYSCVVLSLAEFVTSRLIK